MAFPQPLSSLCGEIFPNRLAAYLEAEFFGSVGVQAHILFSDGAALGSPVVSEDAINHALRAFGVMKNGYPDESNSLKLERHRDTDD